MKIRTKIILPIVLTAVIVLSAATLYSYSFNVRSLKTAIGEHLETAVSSRAHHIDTFLEEQKAKVEMMASSIIFKKIFDKEAFDYDTSLENACNRVNKIVEIDEIIYELFILDTNGKIICSSNGANIGLDKSSDDYFVKGLEGTYIKDAYYSETTGKDSLAISSPIICEDKGCIGVMVARIETTNLNKITADKTGLGETGEVYIVNHEGYAITPLKFEEDSFLKFKVNSENARNCLSMIEHQIEKGETLGHKEHEHIGHKNSAISLNYNGVDVMGSHHPSHVMNWCLLAEINESEAMVSTKELLRFSIIRILIVLFIFFIVAYLLAKAVSKPIVALHHGTEIIEKGNLDYKVGTNTKDEIGQLSRSFDKMTESIKKSRAEVDIKVNQQTKEIQAKQKAMENQQKAILNILEDVDEERSISVKTAQDLEKFQLAVANVSDHIVITDVEGVVLYANKAVENITGFKIKDILGKKVGSKENWGGLMENKVYKKFWQTIKKDKKTFIGELNNQRQNGEKYVALAQVSPILDKNNKVQFFVGIERDITKAKEVDRMKTEFISLASHQLRTPLSAMKWFLEMLLGGDMGKLSKDQIEAIENVNDSNERMIALVNALLNISRIESGRIIIEPTLTDLNKLINQVVVELKPKIEEKKIELVISVHKDLPKIKIDPKLIGEVYKNILTNAIKYTPQKGEITIFVSKKGKEIISQISDTGMGIPKKEQAKVFERFFRAENVVKLETDGTGLGLYLTQKIVSASGGKIWFKSQEGKGTSFWFSLAISGMKAKSGEVRLDRKVISKSDNLVS
jgi:PAS domain S-box-containing protein